MKTSNYFYIACSHIYGMLHGMYNSGGLENVTLEDAKEIALSEAYDIVTGYDCILEAIHEDLNAQFGYDDTSDEPIEEYVDALEDAIVEECEYNIWEITPEGEAHWDEMEEDPESVDDYLKSGWLAPIDERPFEHYFTTDPI